jgi:hypothetical protein
MRAGLAASTVTPGKTAPDVSRMTPAIPLACCAETTAGSRRHAHNRPADLSALNTNIQHLLLERSRVVDRLHTRSHWQTRSIRRVRRWRGSSEIRSSFEADMPAGEPCRPFRLRGLYAATVVRVKADMFPLRLSAAGEHRSFCVYGDADAPSISELRHWPKRSTRRGIAGTGNRGCPDLNCKKRRDVSYGLG